MTTTTPTDSVAAKPGLPPHDGELYRTAPTFELRATGDGEMPTLFGHFAVFNRWTEIDSIWEGRFLERIAPGAFRKTFRENRGRIRALFQHGRDPQVGDKPLGAIDVLREDDTGGYYEVPLLDTAYNREILPGLEAGLYGASFRFRVIREEFLEEPTPSDENPKGLPERTLREVALSEFGPVTFPAYEGATASVRSLTDFFRQPSGLLVPESQAFERQDAETSAEVRAESPETHPDGGDDAPDGAARADEPEHPDSRRVAPVKPLSDKEWSEWISRT